MTSPWQPGQLLFIGFEGTVLPPQLRPLLAAGRVGGIILFARNVENPRQVQKLVREIYESAPEDLPPTIAIDQEGGRVQRLRAPWTEWPPMRWLGRAGDLELTGRVGGALARELHDLGIGLDFAPVVDVDTNPANPVIGDRSFAAEPRDVCAHATAFIRGMQAQGVAACAKHFPGHGDTQHDSHHTLPRIVHDLDRLREVELPPFRAAAEAEVACMMTAHVLFEAIDRKRPATLSPDVMALLREEIGYQGLVFTDDLEMKAVAGRYPVAALVPAALEAGVDAMLACKELSLVEEVLRHLERCPDALVERALERMVAFKQKFPPPRRAADDDEPRPPYPDHEELLREIEKLAGPWR